MGFNPSKVFDNMTYSEKTFCQTVETFDKCDHAIVMRERAGQVHYGMGYKASKTPQEGRGVNVWYQGVDNAYDHHKKVHASMHV